MAAAVEATAATMAVSNAIGGIVSGGDFVVRSTGALQPANNWPGAEAPSNGVDRNPLTKYLSFNQTNTGLIVRTDTSANLALVPGLAEQTARIAELERTLPAGDALRGMVVNQSAVAVTLATGAVTPPVTVAAVEIAEMRVGKASLMPQGLDRILTLGELADVVAFLESLK